MVTWNTAELTIDALRHLLATDQGCDVRVLVHDNGSSDGTPERLRAALPAVDVVAGAENLGFAGAVNRLLARSDRPWFVALNSDAWPEPGALGRLVDAAVARPSAALVAPRIERPDGELEHSTHPFPSVGVALALALGLDRAAPARAERALLNGYWHHDRGREVDWAVGACWLLRRSAVEAVGGLDERFFMYAEDLEWCWRARRSGWSIWFEPSAVVRHVGNASGAAAYGEGRTAAYLRNTYRFYEAEHGRASALAYRGANALGAARHWARSRVRGNREGARWWRRQIALHLRPVGGPDGPPAR